MADNAENADGTTEAEASDAEQTRNQGEIPPEVKRALSKANKEAETLRLKLKEYEDRDKTELDRANERAAEAEKAIAAAEFRALRLEVAAEQGLTPAQAKRLVGETREDLESDAKELLETFKPADNGDDSQGSVTESLDLGIRSGTPKKSKSTADLFAAAIDGSFTR